MAEELGKRLLAEVEEVGLDELLHTIRLRHDPRPSYFGISTLDEIIHTANSSKPNTSTQPTIELTSQAPGSGTTHLIYLITATAILPTSAGGNNACVAILDADGTFSTFRLAQQLRFRHPSVDLESVLAHVHIFRPQSLSSLTATLANLPTYFLYSPHSSQNRHLAFIALDSLTAFHWQGKSAEEDLPFSDGEANESTNLPSLPMALKSASSALSTPVIFTTHLPQNSTAPTLRLTLRRRPVKKFPPTLSVLEALREAGDRQRAVERAGWEAVCEERGAARGMGFGFRITDDGVLLEGEETTG